MDAKAGSDAGLSAGAYKVDAGGGRGGERERDNLVQISARIW